MKHISNEINELNTDLNQIDEQYINNTITHTDLNSCTSNVINSIKASWYSDITADSRPSEILQSNNLKIKPNKILKKCKVCVSTDEVNNAKRSPVGMNTIFNQWQRFSHYTDGQNLNTTAHTQARNKWSYNSSTNAIYTNLNSEVYMGFVSPDKYDYYYLKVRLDGDDDDNDMIGIVLAFITDNAGVQHTLSLVRCKTIEEHTHYRYALVYDYLLTTEYKLDDREDIVPAVSGGWKGTYVIIDAKRSKNEVQIRTSMIGNPNLDDRTLITYKVPSTQPAEYPLEMYENLKQMLNYPAQIGFSAFSETGHFTIQEQKYVFDDNKIYDFNTDTIFEYKSNTWQNVGKISTTLEPGLLYNPDTKKLYKYMEGTILRII